MANVTQNLLDITISAADQTTIMDAFGIIGTTLAPYLRTLTDDQRTKLFSLDVDNKVFVDEALQEVTNNGGILPNAVSGPQLQNDVTLYEQTDEFLSVFTGLIVQVSDTRRLAGHEAYCMALTAFTLFKALAAAGIPGAQQSADRLAERFENSGRPETGNEE